MILFDFGWRLMRIEWSCKVNVAHWHTKSNSTWISGWHVFLRRNHRDHKCVLDCDFGWTMLSEFDFFEYLHCVSKYFAVFWFPSEHGRWKQQCRALHCMAQMIYFCVEKLQCSWWVVTAQRGCTKAKLSILRTIQFPSIGAHWVVGSVSTSLSRGNLGWRFTARMQVIGTRARQIEQQNGL